MTENFYEADLSPKTRRIILKHKQHEAQSSKALIIFSSSNLKANGIIFTTDLRLKNSLIGINADLQISTGNMIKVSPL